jgi:hypothetical protein
MEIAPPPLVLTLDPILPLRAPQPGVVLVSSGFRLRLPDGPAVAACDPLLSAFGARVVDLEVDADDSEALQDDAFALGRALMLLEEGVDEDGDPVVGVWDAEGTRRAGHLDFRSAAEVAAATEAGLAVGAVVLTEDRLRVDDRRCGLEVLVHAHAFVRVDTGPAGAAEAAAPHANRRPRRARERVVLVADGSSELRWWDPAGRGGPMDLGRVLLSSGLLADLERLSDEYAALDDADLAGGAADGFEREMYRASLDARMRGLWQRAQAELGRSYAIGLLGPGMTTPAWSPGETGSPAADDVVF